MNTDFANEKERTQRKKIKQLTLHSDYIAIFSNEKYDRQDGRLINYFNGKRYELETKWYGDEKNKRNSDKYSNYQIDLEKLIYLEKKAKENNSTPLLMVFFSNELVVWDINKCDWKSTKKTVKVNKIGGKYGKEKEESQQVYLMLSDAVYRDKKITPFN
jgi:hypothetical protein